MDQHYCLFIHSENLKSGVTGVSCSIVCSASMAPLPYCTADSRKMVTYYQGAEPDIRTGQGHGMDKMTGCVIDGVRGL